MYVTLKSCPHCKTILDLTIGALSSGLGSPILRCQKCSRPVSTGRKEWESFGGSDHARYFVMSGVYAAAGVVFGYIFGDIGYQILTNGFADKGEIGSDGTFWGALLVPAFLLAVQAYRVWDSKRRNSPTEARSQHVEFVSDNTFFGWQSGVQWKMLLLFVAVVAVVCSAGLFVSTPK